MIKPSTYFIYIILFLTFSFHATSSQAVNEEVPGLVLNQTKSVLAQEFSVGFSQVWRNYPVPPQYSVILNERTLANGVQMIEVKYKHYTLISSRLDRRIDRLELGRAAAEQVIRQLSSVAKQSATPTADLAEDEI